MNKLIAILMALVIANPACCCAFGCGSQDEEAPVHSCCSGSQDSNEEPDQENKTCTCFLEKEKAKTESDFLLSGGNFSDLIPAPNPATDKAAFIPNIPVAVVFISKWPPGHLPIPSLGERLACRSSYLL